MRQALVVFLCLLLLAAPASAEFVFTDGSLTSGAPQTPPPGEEGGDPLFSVSPDGQSVTLVDAEASPGVEILLTATGDVTIGGNMKGNPSSNMYTKALAAKDGNLAYFFANVYDILSTDDLTLINFEGTLTNATRHKDNTYTFRAPPEHAQILTLGSVEAVALENNHTMDFYEQGYQDTVDTLTAYGIVYSSEDAPGIFQTKGVSIAMLSYQTFNNAYGRLAEKVPQDIAKAKAEHDIVIVSYHWGNEEDFAPHDKQIALGRATIDAGADLVLGHHSHRINPIEEYKGKYIVYSLGNCSFAGHTNPANMDTFLFQQKFIVKDGEVANGGFRIVPCSISAISAASGAVSAQNDLAITPFEPGSAAAQRVIDTMLKNSDGLAYAVTEYPVDWE